jgi:hypothetical protein
VPRVPLPLVLPVCRLPCRRWTCGVPSSVELPRSVAGDCGTRRAGHERTYEGCSRRRRF